MATTFPATLDTFTNPNSTDSLNTPAVLHHVQHDNHNDAVAAVEAKVGIDASVVTTSLDYIIKNTTAGHNHDGTNSRRVVLTGTKATILATTATLGWFAFATDTFQIFVGNGTNWYEIPFVLIAERAVPDMGYIEESNKLGITSAYITDKALSNVRILDSQLTSEGSTRTRSGVLQVVLSGAYKNVVTGFVLREDSAEGFEFEHQPVGFTNYIEIMSGNSEVLGLNGLPLTQGYATSIGAYSVPLQIDGGTF